MSACGGHDADGNGADSSALQPGGFQTIPLLALAAFGQSVAWPNVAALISRNIDQQHLGQYLGINNATYALARLAGPFFLDLAFSILGVKAPFWLAYGGIRHRAVMVGTPHLYVSDGQSLTAPVRLSVTWAFNPHTLERFRKFFRGDPWPKSPEKRKAKGWKRPPTCPTMPPLRWPKR